MVYTGNTITTLCTDSLITSAINVRFAVTDTGGYTYKGAGNEFIGNTLHGSHTIFRFGGYDNDGQAQGVQVDSNTVIFDSTWVNVPHWLAWVGYGLRSDNNIIADGDYTDDHDTLIYFNDGGDHDVALKRTWDILIIDSSDTPLEDAIVEITNNYDQQLGTDTSGADGWTHIGMVYWKEGASDPDSTAYNPMGYIVIYDSDTTAVEGLTLAHDRYIDTTKVGSEGEAEKTNHHMSKWRK